MTKQQLRQLVREAKTILTPELRQKAAEYFASRAADIISSRSSKTVLLYASLPDEVPTLEYLEESTARCVLPVVTDDENLELRLYTSSQDLAGQGRYHIPEPTGPLFTDYDAIDLAFIPGMAFDAAHHRLGRGKGYYDRLLAHPAFRQIHKLGVCFDFQLLPHVPAEPHDCNVDELIVIPALT